MSRKYTYKKIFKKNNKQINYVRSIGHCLRTFKKNMVDDFLNIYDKYIKKLRKTIFRTSNMFCFIDGFYLHWLLNNKLELKNTKKTLILTQTDNKNLIENIIDIKNKYSIYLSEQYDFICIEDIRKNNLSEDNKIKTFLESKINIKSKYEKCTLTNCIKKKSIK